MNKERMLGDAEPPGPVTTAPVPPVTPDLGPFLYQKAANEYMTDVDPESREESESGDSSDDSGLGCQHAFDAVNDQLPAAFDENTRLDIIDYSEQVEELPEEFPFDEDVARALSDDSIDQTSLETAVEAPHSNLEDPSYLVPHRQSQFLEISDFEMAFGLFAHSTGLNRAEYASLREIRLLLLTADGNPLTVVLLLPNRLSALKNRVATRLPLLDMRQADISLMTGKLPTSKSSTKDIETADRHTVTSLHFIDPINLFSAFMSTEKAQAMRTGFAHFVDLPVELYHSLSWASSVRTTSGEYAHIQQEDADGNIVNGPVVFPSDFVMYCCTDTDCGCRCQESDGDNYEVSHIGRVIGVGRDYRSNNRAQEIGGISLIVHELFQHPDYRHDSLLSQHPLAEFPHSPPLAYDEVIIHCHDIYIPQEHLISVVSDSVFCDYFWGEDHNDPAPRRGLQEQIRQDANPLARRGQRPRRIKVFRKYDAVGSWLQGEQRPTQSNLRRALVYPQYPDPARCMLVPLCHTHPIRGQLEVDAYGRELFETWDRSASSTIPMLSCSIITFIDGFGLYRNTHKSLVGVYLSPAALTLSERQIQSHMFPLTLGPHGSNFDDVVRSLSTLGDLDRGRQVEIEGKQVVLCVPILCFTGDMPQQAQNSGFRGPRADKFCRSCFCGEQAAKSHYGPDVLHFDIITHGRYHHQSLAMTDQIEAITARRDGTQYGTQWGVKESRPALMHLTPALDVIRTRPADAAHSEFNGLTHLMHAALLDLLNADAREEYTRLLRQWPFPSGWGRLQSPVHHLESYTLAEHARWPVVVPCLLRSWLQRSHMHGFVFDEFVRYISPEAVDEQQVLDTVVSLFAKVAKSNSVLMGTNVSRSDRARMRDIIIDAREGFRLLCMLLSRSIMRNDDDSEPSQQRRQQSTSDISMTSKSGDSTSLPPRGSRGPSVSRVTVRSSRATGSSSEVEPSDYRSYKGD
ncbi:hypothetical protein CCMA1212_005569 [Trichoderma ghanense]|uniref:Uncharacterized protein n=1 Tax=Trichoderma ghanense TaxID=65468 RepID=A0ABY2H4L7_9HYPO